MEGKEQEKAFVADWFHRKWHRVFTQLNKERLSKEVSELKRSFPNDDPAALAKRVILSSARLSGVVGIATAVPALIPGIGTIISIIGILPEEYYLMRKQCEMILKIALVYGYDITKTERIYEILTLIGTPSRGVDALMVAKYDLRRVAAKAVVHLSSQTGTKALVAAKAASRGILRRLPALGFFAGGAINYYSFRSIGKKAAKFYSKQTKKKGKKALLPKKTKG